MRAIGKIKTAFGLFMSSFLVASVFTIVNPSEAVAASYYVGCANGSVQFTKTNNTARFSCSTPTPPPDISTTNFSNPAQYKDAAKYDISCSGPGDTRSPSLSGLNFSCANFSTFTILVNRSVPAASGTGSTGGLTTVPTCKEGEDPATTDCIDSVTKCKDGTVGVPTSDPDPEKACIEFNPDKVTPLSENPILIYIGRITVFLISGVGIILVFVVVIAGLRYTMAKGNPQETAAAKGMIEKVAISALLYVFAFVIINWLIPGGILNG